MASFSTEERRQKTHCRKQNSLKKKKKNTGKQQLVVMYFSRKGLVATLLPNNMQYLLTRHYIRLQPMLHGQ